MKKTGTPLDKARKLLDLLSSDWAYISDLYFWGSLGPHDPRSTYHGPFIRRSQKCELYSMLHRAFWKWGFDGPDPKGWRRNRRKSKLEK